MQWRRTDGQAKDRPEARDPNPSKPPPAAQEILQLQQSAGNQAVAGLLRSQGGVEDVAAGATQPLPHAQSYERALGMTLDGVRVRSGDPAARSALQREGAVAAAVGDAIVFADEAPSSEVVAHELTHVVQQRRGRTAALSSQHAAETEAARLAPSLARGEPASVQVAARQGVPQFLRFGPGTAKPPISHDHGHLDDGSGNIDPSLRREPTAGDYAAFARGAAQLEGAEVLRPDLVDATRGFRHFLYGGGAALTIDYERYLRSDAGGRRLVEQAIRDVREGAIAQDNEWLAAHSESPVPDHDFEMVSETFNPAYPDTENWQKAIGGHTVWITANVNVTVDNETQTRFFSVSFTLNMEDMYNFNPGQADIATGQADSVYGRLERSGLGHEFLQSGSARRETYFDEPLISSAAGASEPLEPVPSREPHGPPDRGRGRPNDVRTR